MPDTNKIGLEAVFENVQFQQGIAQYNSSVNDASSNTDESSSAMSAAWDGLATVGSVAFTALGAGLAAFTAELGFAVNAAMESEDGQAELNAVIASTGGIAGVTAESINEFASAMQQSTKFEDDAIIKGQSLLLTFTKIGSDVFPEASIAMLNLAQKFGSMDSAATQLGKALNDPIQGISALSRVGVVFSDVQKKQIEDFMAVGDIASAQRVILAELETEYGGLAETMGSTTSGKIEILKHSFGDLQETLGGPLLDALSGVFEKLIGFANDPKTIDFFADLGAKIGDVANAIVAKLPDIMSVIEGISTWLSENQAVIVGILAAIGVALLAFGYTAAAAGIAAMAGMWPVIAVMAVIGAVVGVLYKAWTENWGGIQGKVAKAWAQMKPVFDKLQAWLAVNLPKAIKALSNFWTKTLLPAIEKVVGWIVDNVLPLLVDLVLWLGDNIPKAIKILSDFWTKTLLPAIRAVADWIEGTLVPILKVLRDWLEDYLTAALENLTNVWTNVLLPAITAVWDFIKNVLIPIFGAIVDVISGVLIGAIEALSAVWTNVLLPAITAIYNFIQNYIIPIFTAVSNLMTAVVGLAVAVLAAVWKNVLLPALNAVWEAISAVVDIFQEIAGIINGALSTALNFLIGLWQDHLLPALQDVWEFIDTHIIQVFESIADTVNGALMSALNPFVDFLNGVFLTAFETIRDAIQWVVDLINEMIDAVNSFVVPDWWPALPSSSNNNFMGLQQQISAAEAKALPTVTAQLNILASLRDVAGGSTRTPTNNSISNSIQRTNNYLYGAQFVIADNGGVIDTLQNL